MMAITCGCSVFSADAVSSVFSNVPISPPVSSRSRRGTFGSVTFSSGLPSSSCRSPHPSALWNR
jgi:hypothetical protein